MLHPLQSRNTCLHTKDSLAKEASRTLWFESTLSNTSECVRRSRLKPELEQESTVTHCVLSQRDLLKYRRSGVEAERSGHWIHQSSESYEAAGARFQVLQSRRIPDMIRRRRDRYSTTLWGFVDTILADLNPRSARCHCSAPVVMCQTTKLQPDQRGRCLQSTRARLPA